MFSSSEAPKIIKLTSKLDDPLLLICEKNFSTDCVGLLYRLNILRSNIYLPNIFNPMPYGIHNNIVQHYAICTF